MTPEAKTSRTGRTIKTRLTDLRSTRWSISLQVLRRAGHSPGRHQHLRSLTPTPGTWPGGGRLAEGTFGRKTCLGPVDVYRATIPERMFIGVSVTWLPYMNTCMPVGVAHISCLARSWTGAVRSWNECSPPWQVRPSVSGDGRVVSNSDGMRHLTAYSFVSSDQVNKKCSTLNSPCSPPQHILARSRARCWLSSLVCLLLPLGELMPQSVMPFVEAETS